MSRFWIPLILFIFLLNACNPGQNNLQNENDKMLTSDEADIKPRSINMANELEPDQQLENHQEAFPLLINDFQARWNAVSEEQTGDLHIYNLTRGSGTNQFLANLREGLDMELYTLDDNQISRIKILGVSKTSDDLYRMITSWWQVLMITNPQSELHEIDTIFSKIGFGPNANFNDIQETAFSFGGLEYKVTPTENYISFEAIYPNGGQK